MFKVSELIKRLQEYLDESGDHFVEFRTAFGGDEMLVHDIKTKEGACMRGKNGAPIQVCEIQLNNLKRLGMRRP